MDDSNALQWPLSSVIYQIYPRSFQDSNNDGIGDLQGIIQRLGYLKSLGINAIWLSPIYPSPQADFGYDIADYTNINPEYGTMADFDELLKKTHEQGINLIMDYVPNHTSDQHSWFLESKSSKDNPKRAWYIWADPKSDGSPPNNWKSVFGGSAWELDKKTNQYYLHTWDKKQVDLNWRNPEVEKAMLNVLRFWMDKGVDGFRVDAIEWLFKDPSLRDEPINPTARLGVHSEYDHMLHPYTFALPETITAMKKMVNTLKEYPGKFMVTEAMLSLPELIKRYAEVDWRWYQPFNFSLITLPWTAEAHKPYIDEYDKALGDIYLPCWVLGNHDQHRVGTRIGEKQARIAAILELTLRGFPFIYNGEEIGMIDTEIPKDRILDPFEINSPGLNLGRDPERTPIQWDTSVHAGFSKHEPWLPVNGNFHAVNAESEEKDPHSMLALYKRLIKLRKEHPALREGSYVPLPNPAKNVLAYLRKKSDDQLLVLLNFDSQVKQISLPFEHAKILTCICPEEKLETMNLKDIALGGDEGYVFQVI